MRESAVRRGGRRRAANVEGGRRFCHQVKVSESQELELQLLADEAGVTVSRLLLESALARDGMTASERGEVTAQLFAVYRYLGALSNNVNQIAKAVNAGAEVHADLAATLAAVRAQMPRVQVAVRVVADLSARGSVGDEL